MARKVINATSQFLYLSSHVPVTNSPQAGRSQPGHQTAPWVMALGRRTLGILRSSRGLGSHLGLGTCTCLHLPLQMISFWKSQPYKKTLDFFVSLLLQEGTSCLSPWFQEMKLIWGLSCTEVEMNTCQTSAFVSLRFCSGSSLWTCKYRLAE